MDFLESLSGWIGQITEILLGLVALAIVLQILFGGGAAFLPSDVVGNLVGLIQSLGDNGLVGLIALAIIIYLYKRNVA